ncbi:MAG: sodium ion-translocating decarboxylase subunit beta [Chloroflexi bacterium]|nr:sodium ion-translocating decarboxylase subunit beta [Chloroflexota bacterium]
MLLIAGGLLFLAIRLQYEPLLLVPIAFGIFLVNLPGGFLVGEKGFFTLLLHAGVETEFFPLLIFVGLGALTDFSPLLADPKTVLLGAAAQIGIYLALLLALPLGFSLREAGAIGIIGSADGPTTIYTATILAPHLLGPVAVAAYSYMSMVPIIQPPIARLLTTRAERRIKMPYPTRMPSRMALLLFPIATAIVGGLFAPAATPLIGLFMFGNLLRVCGVVERLSQTAQNELMNIAVMLQALTVGSTMSGANFLNPSTLMIFFLGLFAFATATAGGLLLGKLMCWLSGGKVNPLIGGAGVSAVPMSARVAQRLAQAEDGDTYILMQAMGPNVAGVIGSALAAGVLLAVIP